MALCCCDWCYSVFNDFTLLYLVLSKRAVILLIIFISLFSLDIEAQCAMCRAVLESEEGQSTAQGINDGIVYLMVIPYILVGGIGYIIYYKFFRTKSKA